MKKLLTLTVVSFAVAFSDLGYEVCAEGGEKKPREGHMVLDQYCYSTCLKQRPKYNAPTGHGQCHHACTYWESGGEMDE